MKTFEWLEDLDRRILAAVRFVNDVDGSPISGPLEVTGDPAFANGADEVRQLKILRNRAGLHGLQYAPKFRDYCATFIPDPTAPTPPPAPESSAAHLRVNDPAGRYLPAAFIARLPRALPGDPSTAPRASDPLEIRLLPAPAAPLADGWAVLRVTVWRELAGGARVPLHGALVRVLRPAAEVTPTTRELLGRGLTDWRRRPDGSAPDAAEALVAVPRIPVVQFSTATTGSVLSATQGIRLELRYAPAFDPAKPAALPNLAALSAQVPPLGIKRVALPADTTQPDGAPLTLRARQRSACSLLLTAAGELQLSQPPQP